ncbi:hypothetical protein [Rugosimonospora acidiphila]
MLRALAKRDDEGFKYWRIRMNDDEEAKRTLYAMYYEAFREAADRRFPVGGDVRDIARFLAQPRVPLSPEMKLPVVESEALIRSALGERGLVKGIPKRMVSEIRMQLFVYLVEDLDLPDEKLDTLLEAAEGWVYSS